ncbi:hypothetical protein cco77_03019 [Campylobacter coli LMG 23341]|nr:hypothetical protein cco77_03019 [Campylobacter coli LMG 23341]
MGDNTFLAITVFFNIIYPNFGFDFSFFESFLL